jgi:hypothetical protein
MLDAVREVARQAGEKLHFEVRMFAFELPEPVIRN